jgi:hypothetical protein
MRANQRLEGGIKQGQQMKASAGNAQFMLLGRKPLRYNRPFAILRIWQEGVSKNEDQ